MKRFPLVAGAMLLGLLVSAAEGKHIARAVLQAKTGATVASAQADMNGRIRFSNVPPGVYKLVLTNADGRSVSVGDLDGDGTDDLVIAGNTGGGAGKVNIQDISMTKSSAPGSGGKVVGGALPGGAVVSSAVSSPGIVSPRDHASGLPTGKRTHKPYACLVDWDGAVKGGFHSEIAAQSEGQKLPENTSGRCAIKVLVDEQPGTIEVMSWSWGASKHTKTGHVTLMK